jgi:sarcosine oxidase/L-pipecolate oxidase
LANIIQGKSLAFLQKIIPTLFSLFSYLNPRETDQISVPRTQVTHACDTIPIGALREFRQFLGKFLPETSALDITYARMCWYSDSIDGHFVVCPHPDYHNLVVATGDSGHAMK